MMSDYEMFCSRTCSLQRFYKIKLRNIHDSGDTYFSYLRLFFPSALVDWTLHRNMLLCMRYISHKYSKYGLGSFRKIPTEGTPPCRQRSHKRTIGLVPTTQPNLLH